MCSFLGFWVMTDGGTYMIKPLDIQGERMVVVVLVMMSMVVHYL